MVVGTDTAVEKEKQRVKEHERLFMKKLFDEQEEDDDKGAAARKMMRRKKVPDEDRYQQMVATIEAPDGQKRTNFENKWRRERGCFEQAGLPML